MLDSPGIVSISSYRTGGLAFGGACARAASAALFLACALPPAAPGAEVGGEPSVPYRARLTGAPSRDLRRAVRAQSLTMSLASRPPATVRQLQRRAEDDLPAMAAVLKAAGYLDATVAAELDAEAVPAQVTFRVSAGARYSIRAFRVVYAGAADTAALPSTWPRLRKGGPAAASDVAAAEASILRALRERGHPNPRLVSRAVTADASARQVDVVCTVDPGPRATLGAVEIEGLERLQAGYVRRRVTWTPGAAYDVRRLEDLERSLTRSGLFSSVRVAAADAPDAAGRSPVRVAVTERPHRTFRAGVSYYSDEGAGALESWENRNILGQAEALSFSLQASGIGYGGEALFVRPDITTPDVDLRLELDARDEYPDAYRSRNGRAAVVLEKRIERTWTFAGGLAGEYGEVEQQEETERYGLLSVPLSVDWDRRDDALDPSRGFALHVATAPYEDTLGNGAFVKSLGEANAFVPLSDWPRIVFAARATMGTIAGLPADDVPADKRFYVGGGGSVRGYKYQSIGPLEDGDPVGGKAMATASAEIRARMPGDVGAAVFIDGGTAYPDSRPDSETPFRWGAGAGLRYYLGVAPLRVDVAFPLQRRDGMDAAYQIYVSLGQAF